MKYVYLNVKECIVELYVKLQHEPKIKHKKLHDKWKGNDNVEFLRMNI